MKDNNYEMVVMYLERAREALQAAKDELDEYGDRGYDSFFSDINSGCIGGVNRLISRVRCHERELLEGQNA